MARETKIQYVDATASPWTGCTEVSLGCVNCYARELAARRGWAKWGNDQPRHRFKGFTKAAMAIQRGYERRLAFYMEEDIGPEPPRPKVFPSLCDWLDPMVPIEWLTDFLRTIRDTPHIDWLLLTKRPELFRDRISRAMARETLSITGQCPRAERLGLWLEGAAPANIWIGVSVEDQTRLEERTGYYLDIPATKHFLSCEPLLGALDFEGDVAGVADWVIVGGESGPKARPCNTRWIESIVQQCQHAKVPVFVKQLGSNIVMPHPCPPGGTEFGAPRSADDWFWKTKHSKGGDPKEWPEDLRVQEYPE